jgi:putative oxidoreductase
MDIPAFVATMPRRDLPMARLCHPPVEFIGGVFSVIGFVTRYTAMIMLLFIIIATFSSHRYWNFLEAQRANQNSHFWTDVSMMDGAVLLFIIGAGRLSVDRILNRN